MVTYLKFSKDACKPEVKLYGKTVLITGANSGKMKMWPALNSKIKPRMLCNGNRAISHLETELGFVEDFHYSL